MGELLFATFAATLAAIPAVTEAVKKVIFSITKQNMNKIWTQVVSLLTGFCIVLVGWLFELGWLKEINWQYMLLYAVVASLSSNGVFDLLKGVTVSVKKQ